jgi:hypothetical protein
MDADGLGGPPAIFSPEGKLTQPAYGPTLIRWALEKACFPIGNK